MNRSQCNYNRRIKRTDYEIGDLVLVCHPMLKKGLSKGLVRRYYGPFKVVGKYENGCDYLIKSTNQPKANVKQIHVNNLKTYFDRGQPKPSNKPSPFQDSKKSTDDEAKIQPNSQKRYKKGPYNLVDKRWSFPMSHNLRVTKNLSHSPRAKLKNQLLRNRIYRRRNLATNCVDAKLNVQNKTKPEKTSQESSHA